jgi:hypothetical protein
MTDELVSRIGINSQIHLKRKVSLCVTMVTVLANMSCLTVTAGQVQVLTEPAVP